MPQNAMSCTGDTVQFALKVGRSWTCCSHAVALQPNNISLQSHYYYFFASFPSTVQISFIFETFNFKKSREKCL